MPGRRPNVVLVVVDTLRADRLGCYGNARGLTPNIDAEASHGIVFRRAYAQSSWTMPSVVSLLTSLLPHKHGVVGYESMLRDDVVTLADTLARSGYVTGAFVANPLIRPSDARGFETFHGPPMNPGSPPAWAARLNLDVRIWLEDHVGPHHPLDPIFLYVHYMDTHPPYGKTRHLERMFGSRPLPDLAAVNAAALLSRVYPMSSDMAAALRDTYDAEVAEVDEQIGVLLSGLRVRHLLDDAVVVITADHGEEFWDHGSTGHGHTVYEELIRVPLVMTVSGRDGGSVVDDPTSLVDVAPTVLELATVPILPSFEGHSRASVVTRAGFASAIGAFFARPFAAPQVAFSELFDANPSRTLRTVIRGSEKEVARGDGTRSFYDLASDPGEQNPTTIASADRERLDALLKSLPANAAHGPATPLADESRERLRALGYTN
jgi:arylsulfatase A-like enzyme